MSRRPTTVRFYLALLLPLLLACVQQGAWLHQLGHTYYSAHTGIEVGHPDAGDEGGQCPICQSFAQVGSAACGPTPCIVPAAPIRLRSPDPRFSIVAARAPTPRSRGPPLI